MNRRLAPQVFDLKGRRFDMARMIG